MLGLVATDQSKHTPIRATTAAAIQLPQGLVRAYFSLDLSAERIVSSEFIGVAMLNPFLEYATGLFVSLKSVYYPGGLQQAKQQVRVHLLLESDQLLDSLDAKHFRAVI